MINAGIAQLVERHVANVDVASSSLVSRSKQVIWLLTSPEFSLGVFILYGYGSGWVAEW